MKSIIKSILNYLFLCYFRSKNYFKHPPQNAICTVGEDGELIEVFTIIRGFLKPPLRFQKGDTILYKNKQYIVRLLTYDFGDIQRWFTVVEEIEATEVNVTKKEVKI